MNLITLNTWGGRGGIEKLLAFFATHRDTDIFCLQEMWNGGEEMVGKLAGGVPMIGVQPTLLKEIQNVLPHHRTLFHPHLRDFYGLAMLIHRDIPVTTEGELFVHKEKGYESDEDLGMHARNIQYATIETEKGKRTIINFHGLWNGKGKSDSEDRLRQSENICAFIKNLETPCIIAGDFNLTPDTESICMLENASLRNLIKEYGITSTRTSLYSKPERFADYVLVDPRIKVEHFEVLPDEVSDHAPLFLSF